MQIFDFNLGDQVAILPHPDSPPSETIEIATIHTAGQVFVQLTDGRTYASIGGKSLNATITTYIVPATNLHRAAWQAKLDETPPSASA